ncbi:hypothetical protein [Porphyromonas crevioricanis]|nr:hypothetical protein [Porphyromonas crevioricanis]SJZ86850.1 hypothetical protein SAMN02745203_01104 [Porphyromonas crevioricanis]
MPSSRNNESSWLVRKFGLSGYLDEVNKALPRNAVVSSRIEPRTRKEDFADALSFEVFDPLWTLTRQWQFGRFKANDSGSIVTTKISTVRTPLSNIVRGGEVFPYSTDTPLEYEVEKLDRRITPYIRVSSATHFKKMLENHFGADQSKIDFYLGELLSNYPLATFIPPVKDADRDIETLKREANKTLVKFSACFEKRIFDGYTLYRDANLFYEQHPELETLLKKYSTWFRKMYLPNDLETSCWNERTLGYDVEVKGNGTDYKAESYDSDTLSWYSFDGEEKRESDGVGIEKMLSYLPTPADIPGAPKRRLWEFEYGKVRFGENTGKDYSMLANSVIMQYTSMYSNDWLLTPLESETGTILDVKGIIVTDTFGDRIFINTTPEESDNHAPEVEFSDRWGLFRTTKLHAYDTNDFSSCKGLLFPPTILRSDMSDPLEEIEFLRDEMANMVWGVETKINDGCGGTMDGGGLSDTVLSVIDARKDPDIDVGEEQDAEYYYLLQNRVPINWIPFLPMKIQGELRDIQLRRSKMPIFFNGKYQPVRPSTELLACRYSKNADGSQSRKIIPFVINEEEILGYGTTLSLKTQRARWFFGDSFLWTGISRKISNYQANSGLMFDELVRREDDKAIQFKEMK